MNCKSFDKLIGSFIENKGDIKEAKEFIRHYENCDKCRVEFETDFYAYWGLKMLNDPNVDSYNIAEEMKKTLDAAREQIRYEKIVRFSFVIIIFVACLILAFLLLKSENII